MRNGAQQQNSKPFKGCILSVQLNGLKVLTVDEGNIIKEIISFIAAKDPKKNVKEFIQ